jgi:raffinose/stachyose/melibiose transport system permease protein
LYTGSAGLGRTFTGFDNFVKLFTVPRYSERYRGAFAHTFLFFFIHLAVQNGLGIIFATLLAGKNLKGREFYQTVIFLPVALAVLVTGCLWKLFLNPVWSGRFLQQLHLDLLPLAGGPAYRSFLRGAGFLLAVDGHTDDDVCGRPAEYQR